jgi:DNA-binding FadR family transcriptional regulator
MSSQSLVEQTVGILLDRFLAGEFGHLEPLPSETELVRQLDVSRLTLREAVRALRSQGVLKVRRGRGTYLSYFPEWVLTREIIQAIGRANSEAKVRVDLLQIREMIEVSAVKLFAATRTQQHIDSMEQLFREMQASHESLDVARFSKADVDFHNIFLHNCDNVFIPMMLGPITEELYAGRLQTSSVAVVRNHAQTHHRLILDAIISADPESCGKAVMEHITQTAEDLLKEVMVPASLPAPKPPMIAKER